MADGSWNCLVFSSRTVKCAAHASIGIMQSPFAQYTLFRVRYVCLCVFFLKFMHDYTMEGFFEWEFSHFNQFCSRNKMLHVANGSVIFGTCIHVKIERSNVAVKLKSVQIVRCINQIAGNQHSLHKTNIIWTQFDVQFESLMNEISEIQFRFRLKVIFQSLLRHNRRKRLHLRPT